MTHQILEHIEKKQLKEAANLLKTLNAVQISEILDELEPQLAILVFRMLPKNLAADVFSYLSSEQQMEIINLINDSEIKVILEELYFDDMIDLIEEMPANVVKRILKNTREDERRLINQFLQYPEDSAGSIMTIEYVDLKKTMTVRQAIERIKKIGIEKETIYTCYVLDNDRTLDGIISLRKLVTSDDDATIESIMKKNFMAVHTHDDQEDVALIFKKYDLMALPVIDAENRLTGIITIDDIMDVVDRENTEDFQKMAGMQPSEGAYLDVSIFSMAKQRILWLMVLMISATFTGRIIQQYESVLQSIVILAAFIPMLMDTGGNAGSQSSTMIIRGLALGELTNKDIFKILRKEISVAVMVGFALALINFLRIRFFEGVQTQIALTVTVTLFFTIILAKTVGCVLPIVANALKIDPAVMASPLITTVVDAVALIIYFGLAMTFLGIA